MSFEERGGKPSKVVDFLSKFNRDVRHIDQVIADVQNRRLKIVRQEVESSTTAPYRPMERGYRCRQCRDRGVIDYVQEAPFRDRVIEYRFVARCYCPAAGKVSQSIPTFADVFGDWPRSPGARVSTEPKPTAPEELPGETLVTDLTDID